jgi:dTDP-4-dehydrorhamnose reductase
LRILLTGADGQLGHAVRAAFGGHELVCRGHTELDVADLPRVREAVGQIAPDLLLNAAAYTDVDGAEERPEAAFAANAVAPRNLALATREADVVLLHVSSDYVFDGHSDRPYHEFDAPGPLGTYGRSKLAGEEEVRRHNPRHYIVRSAWLYGPVGRNFALTMRSLSDREEVRVVADQHGSPTYAPHLAEGLARLVETRAFGTFHLASQGVASWCDLARALLHGVGANTRVVPIPTFAYPQAALRPRFSALTSLQNPRILLPHWEDGVKEFVAATRASPA